MLQSVDIQFHRQELLGRSVGKIKVYGKIKRDRRVQQVRVRKI